MSEFISILPPFCSSLDKRKLYSFDVQIIETPTRPVVFQRSRFFFFTSGKGKLQIQDVEYDVLPGVLVALHPWQVLRISQVEKHLQCKVIDYCFDTLNMLLRSYYNTENKPLQIIERMSVQPIVYCDKEQQETIRAIFGTIEQETGRESLLVSENTLELAGIYTVNKILELIVLFCRMVTPAKELPARQGSDAQKVVLFQYMYAHLNENLTLKKLAQSFYLSESTISTYIRNTMGHSFYDLIDEMRIGRASNFLLYTDLTLEELAGILGYVDPAHMSKLFFAKVNMKITEYRKAYQRVSDICKIKETRKSYEIVAYLYRRYQEDVRMKDLIENFGMGAVEINRILLQYVEKNFGDFVNYLRINKSCQLLVETDHPQVDIAVEVGYNTLKTFQRNFYRFQGMTPSKYRSTVRRPGEGKK
ncbi:helix-turn-helix domain-containing protein [Provencibacterium massiliense]|uniref:helix-turn-helix domain-containing protein n=1 Tax=Provencibacterium massiliense TaxID=1841868 RepID=UPI00135637D7|nr:AraC family transcriptional regulator [Provencibacterium massiliense]